MVMKIGQIEKTGNPGKRDAIHVPVVLARSLRHLRGGDNVQFSDSTCVAINFCGDQSKRHGIIDPFVDQVAPGELVHVWVEPTLVGNLVHHFEIQFPAAVLDQEKAAARNARPGFLLKVDKAKQDAEKVAEQVEKIKKEAEKELLKAAEEEEVEEDEDDGCAGCYGETDDDEEEDSSCKGCY